MLQKQTILAIVSLFIFMISFDFTQINGYSLLGMFFFGIIFYFGFEHILTMFQSGRSILSIVIFIIIISILSAFGWAGYTIYTNKQNINKQWPQYRCKPYILPFAGWAVGPSGISGTDNFTNCMWSINKSFFDVLMSPFIDMMKIIVNILSSLTHDVQNVRKIVAYMRESIEDIAKDVNGKIWDAYYRISYLFKVLLKTFSQLGTVFKDLFEVLTYTFYTMASLWNGPIGGVSNFFCFDGYTSIKMNNKSKKYIKDIKVGDVLEDNNGVIGILEFDSTNTPMYCYKNAVVVSGEHLVEEDDKWIRVYKSGNSELIKEYYTNRIYCLITESGIINVEGIRFTDYNETSDRIIMKNIYNYILSKLNKNYKPINHTIPLHCGLGHNTKIILEDNVIKQIKNVKIGDRILNCGRVLAKIKILPHNVYEYKNIIMSGNNIVYHYDEWRPLIQVANIKSVDYTEPLYHIITENNMINLYGDVLIRDFEQLGGDINVDIDNYIERELN